MSLPGNCHHDLDFGLTKGLTLSHIHSSGSSGIFPIGNILDPDTPADQARRIIEREIGYSCGPIVHVTLNHQEHGKVIVLDELPEAHTELNCDAVIFPKGWYIAVETMLGDCPCIIIDGPEHLGFIHGGRPELFAGIIPNFMELWPDPLEQTKACFSPGICGRHYELLDVSAVAGTSLAEYVCETVWGTQGYDLVSAYREEFKKGGIVPFWGDSQVCCPFCERIDHIGQGYATDFASDQFFRVKKMDPHKRPFSPRDCAFLHYEPKT